MHVQLRRASAGPLLATGLLLLMTLASAVPLFAAESPRATQVRALNNRVLALHAQMQSEADVVSVRAAAAKVIQARGAALRTLITEEPATALTLAFSPELLADLGAKFPASAALLEAHTTVSGHVQHWIADYPDESSRSWWRMDTGGGTLDLYYAGPEPANLKSDDVLQATGVVVGYSMAVEKSVVQSRAAWSGATHSPGASSQSPVNYRSASGDWPVLLICALLFGLPHLVGKIRLSRERILSSFKQFATEGLVFGLIVLTSMPSYAQSSCSTTGVQKVIVILVDLPGGTLPSNITPAAMGSMFFGATAPSVNNYWQETSYGLASAAGDVYGPFALTGTYSSTACQSLTAVQSDAMSAAAASGANFQNYNRVVVILPDVLGCGWSGFSNIGCSSLSTPSGTINASSSYLSAASATVQVATHELGHGLGLSHAASRGFTDSTGKAITLGPLGTTGTLIEYGDSFSTMACCEGNVGGEYGAPHKAEILNWLPPNTGYQTVQSSGSYTLQPYEVPGGLKAIKVQRGTGNNAWLWLEYRQPDGYYDPASFPDPVNTFLPPQPYSGALIHYEDSTTGLYTNLINYTPSDSSFFSPALVAGQSWSDPYTNLSLSIQGATSSGLTVSVNYGTVPCTHANPSVSITPFDPSTYPGTGASYTMSITNNDSSGCSASTFVPSSTEPSGFTSAFLVSSVSLSPGQSGSLTVTVTPAAGTAPGTYPVSASASNSSYVGTATANTTVLSAPSLSVGVAVPSSSYARKSTVPVAATVLIGGSPASGASVTFALTTAAGSKVTQLATTDSKGTATWSYKLSPSAPTGTYSVSAQASYTAAGSSTPQRATSNVVSFSVQ